MNLVKRRITLEILTDADRVEPLTDLEIQEIMETHMDNSAETVRVNFSESVRVEPGDTLKDLLSRKDTYEG